MPSRADREYCCWQSGNVETRSFFEWFRGRVDAHGAPWLLLGKGPSFGKLDRFDLTGYQTLSLNHVVRELPVTAAHLIDWDVFVDAAEAIERNAQVMVAPWYPHRRNRAGRLNLDQLCLQHPALQRLRDQGRLLWYNLSTAPEVRLGSPIVEATSFSAEAALNLLALAGVRRVRSLGIDGGTAYSQQFFDLRNRTLLSNGQPNFNRQFAKIARTLLRTGIDYAPLDVESPVRILVAATDSQMLSFKVLEYSIRKHASMSVSVVPVDPVGIEFLQLRDDPDLLRKPWHFALPHRVGHIGRAICMHSDMQVFRDIRRLWEWPLEDGQISTTYQTLENRPRFGVAVMDCPSLAAIEQIADQLKQGPLDQESLRETPLGKRMRFDLGTAWNSCERFSRDQTALLHFTDIRTRPWVSIANPLGHLWVGDLIEAVDHAFLTLDDIEQHVAKGHVRPSLIYQVKNRILDAQTLSTKVVAMDERFSAASGAVFRKNTTWGHPLSYARAVLRNYTIQAKSPRLARLVARLLAGLERQGLGNERGQSFRQ